MVILGMTHLHVVHGHITEEWTVDDKLAMLTQIKLRELAACA